MYLLEPSWHYYIFYDDGLFVKFLCFFLHLYNVIDTSTTKNPNDNKQSAFFYYFLHSFIEYLLWTSKCLTSECSDTYWDY